MEKCCGNCKLYIPNNPRDPIDGRCNWTGNVPSWLLGLEWDRERVRTEGTKCFCFTSREEAGS